MKKKNKYVSDTNSDINKILDDDFKFGFDDDDLETGKSQKTNRGKKKFKRKRFLIVPVVLLAPIVAAYFAGVVYYKSHFFEGTDVFGTDISNMKVEDFESGLSDYKIKVSQKGADGESFTEEISSEDMGISVSSTDSLSKILNEQNAWLWPTRINGGAIYCDGELLISYDEDKIREAVRNLKNMQAENVVVSQNAYLSDYIKGEGYKIIEEVIGNEMEEDAVVKAIEEAVITLSPTVDCTEADCYKKPKITSDNKKLNKLANTLNTYTGTKLTYEFGDNTEILDGDTINDWLKIKKNKVTIKEDKIAEFVATLRRKYDTIFGSRKFKTSYGKTITITGGDYGWWMNTPEEIKTIKKLIKKGKRGKRVPAYYQTAQSYGENDYGNTYVEVNLTAQHVILYKNGKKVIEADCVTGNSARGYDTPAGVYGITYKETNATLKGENYSTPVSYWMPFNKNIGLHDANWRSSFGGELYRTSGSHGCVNLPPAVAKIIFENVEQGTPVICYHLEGTKSGDIDQYNKKSNSKKDKNV